MFMQIKRMIFGTEVTIDLTDGEILDAYYETERYNTREMLNERLMQEVGIKEEIPAELFSKMVDEVMCERESIDENMGSNIFPAMDAVIEKHEEDLRPYKEEPMGLFEIEVTRTTKHTWTVRAKDAEDADRIFGKWREKNLDEYDYALADEDIEDEDIGSAYACEGDPEYADISEEE